MHYNSDKRNTPKCAFPTVFQ